VKRSRRRRPCRAVRQRGQRIALQSRTVAGGPARASSSRRGAAMDEARARRRHDHRFDVGRRHLWTNVGDANVAMSATAFVGIAVSSHNTSRAAAATVRQRQRDGSLIATRRLAERRRRDARVKGTTVVAAGTSSTLQRFTSPGSGATSGRNRRVSIGFTTLTADGELVARGERCTEYE